MAPTDIGVGLLACREGATRDMIMRKLVGLTYSQAREVLRLNFNEMDNLIDNGRLRFDDTAFGALVQTADVRKVAAELWEERILDVSEQYERRRRARRLA